MAPGPDRPSATAMPLAVHVVVSLSVGGVQTHLLQLLPAMREFGWRAEVVAISREGALAAEFRAAGVPVTRVPITGDRLKLMPRNNPLGLRRIARFLRRRGATVMQSHTYRANIPGALAAAKARTPVIVGTNHNVGLYAGRPDRARRAARVHRRRHACICVSRAVRDYTAAEFGSPDRLTVLPNGIAVPPDRPVADPDERATLAQEFGFPADARLILHVSRLAPQKNHPAFLRDAAPLVVASEPRARLLIVGDGDGDELDRLRALVAADARLTGRVILAGARRDIDRLMRHADAVILPSRREGMPITVLEAMAAGRPIVATDAGGTPELIRNGVDGIIVPAADMPGFGAQLSRLLTADPALADRLGASAHARALSEFSIRRTAQRHVELYERLLRGEPPPPIA
jgi:glycosyltransferase involved in cell wall biosynthesis